MVRSLAFFAFKESKRSCAFSAFSAFFESKESKESKSSHLIEEGKNCVKKSKGFFLLVRIAFFESNLNDRFHKGIKFLWFFQPLL
jgi:hypothetical protein